MGDIKMFVFFTESEFWKVTRAFQKEGKYWIDEIEPSIKKSDFPIVLNVRNTIMMYGKINVYKEQYFSNPAFVKLYNYYKKLHRKKKMKRINGTL